MGCTNCGGKVGCDHRKGAMLAEVDRTLGELYPTRTWGEPRDYGEPAVTIGELAALADDLASELAAATFVRVGGDDEACDYIYVLCMGRVPCAVQVRDHGVAVPAEWLDVGDRALSELYLRLVVSHRARVAAVQQVAITMECGDRSVLLHEAPRAGVYDPPLLPRMQKLVAQLAAHDLLHIDFGEIAHPPPGFHVGSWRESFGSAAPAIANYLFYPQPTTMVSTTLLAAKGGVQ